MAITSKISESFNAAVRDHKDNFGWQGLVYPKGRMAIFNVPETAGVLQTQFVQNVITGAWCTFSNMNANCWGLLNDNLYFAGNGGIVYRADYGVADIGSEITGEMKTAFSACGVSGNKFFKAMRPFMSSPGTSEILADVDVDFEDETPENSFAEGLGSPGIWDVSLWDVAYWDTDPAPVKKWQSVGKIGVFAAPHIIVNGSGGAVRIDDFAMLFEPSAGSIY